MASLNEWNDDADLVAHDHEHIWFHTTNESRKLSNMHNKIEKSIDQFLMNVKKLTDPNEEKCGMKLYSCLTQLIYQRHVFNQLTNGAIAVLAQMNTLYSMSANRPVSLNILVQGECVKEILAAWCEYLASCHKLATSKQVIRQKLIDSYRDATIKARKSEKALRQMQRKTYAQLFRCGVRPYDKFKESMQMSRSLFQLEPMKCEQILKLNVKTSVVNSSEGSTKPMAFRDSQKLESGNTKYLLTEHGSMYCKNLTNGAQTNDCTQKSLNVLQSTICATKRSNNYGRSKEIACSQLQLASTQSLSNSDLIDFKRHTVTLLNGTAKIPIETSITNEGYFANDVRKRKRSEDIFPDESKTNNFTLCKKQKLDCVYVNSTRKAEIPEIGNRPFTMNNRRQGFLVCGKRDTKNSCQVDANNELAMKCKRTVTSDQICKSQKSKVKSQICKIQKCKSSLMSAVIKPQLGCKWVECKVNHPIKQSKSRIPLLIHQLGSKNETNLAAHMKRIGAYKTLSNHQKKITPS